MADKDITAQMLMQPQQQSLTAYHPSWREQIAQWLIGDDQSLAKRNLVGGVLGTTGMGPQSPGLIDATPLGIPLAVNESYQAGDPQGMALAAAPFGAGARGASALARDAKAGIRAYHGSPHDFDRFDLSKIGTGEGAQAYGHGLYFAEKPEVAEIYKDALTNSGAFYTFPKLNAAENKMALDLLPPRYADNPKAFQGELAARFLDAMQNGEMDKASVLRKILDNKAGAPSAAKGRMYEVNINAEPHQFLDWDKPLGQQSAPVRDIMNRIGRNPDTAIDRVTDDLRGSQLYNSVARNVVPTPPLSYEGATSVLRDAGIPGIKYLDQGSRTAGDGSRNYVVFNDKLIDILKKYGLAGASASPLASFIPQTDPAQQGAM